ncbi:unnamed protein product [marine sediment metagenome]|uniref:Uncharacterized protein n=1 Tax=marine sediment metagenome TaxID=412755 RepID=X0XK25_9ZZZZ
MDLQHLYVGLSFIGLFVGFQCMLVTLLADKRSRMGDRAVNLTFVAAIFIVFIIAASIICDRYDYNPEFWDRNEIYINRLIKKNQSDRDKRVEKMREEHLKNGLLFKDI